jgi:RNA polymerase sigma factor (sigma-70 family)
MSAYPEATRAPQRDSEHNAGGGRQEEEDLIIRYRRLVEFTARRFFPRLRHDQDLLQCGLIGLWEATRTWSGAGEFAAYASRCILNNMKDYVRSEQKARVSGSQKVREGSRGYEEALIDRLDNNARIKAAWPENSRERYVLLALSAGVCKQAVAAALGVDLHTVRRIAVRAMEKLEADQNG